MDNTYIIKGGKIVTVSKHGTIYNGAIVVSDGKIIDVGQWKNIRDNYYELEVLNYEDYVITPSLVDCHTHLLEFAPSSLYPVTPYTHLMGGTAILLHALTSGITALGEQICGHPTSNLKLEDYKKAVTKLPIDISFCTASISIGFENLVHFTSVTGSLPVAKTSLTEKEILENISDLSEYPGENIFINATPANLEEEFVPRAGEIMYTMEELKAIVSIYHKKNKKIGAHVGGQKAIDMALEAGIDILHHAHGITKEQIKKIIDKKVVVVATPLGGTHLPPNSPEEVVDLAINNIIVSIATDAYLPPSKKAPWLNFKDEDLKGPEVLMALAQPSMQILSQKGWNENDILALITLNGAKVLGKDHKFGSIQKGMDANFIVTNGVPGLEITDIEKIYQVFFRGLKVIDKTSR